MELRNRATRRDAPTVPAKRQDVTLGPTVYSGERYGKMSERIKRQQRRVPDVNETANRLITPRLIGVAVGLFLVACFLMYLKHQATQRQTRRLTGK